MRKHTKLPIVLKGIQTAEDAKMAMDAGMDGIMLSNHGGRSLDTSPPAIFTLLEIHKNCPEVFDHLEVLIDGGIRRGTDILKALCLGATAVGIGRSFLYATNYGQEGVEHLIESEYYCSRLSNHRTLLIDVLSPPRRARDLHENGRHNGPVTSIARIRQHARRRPPDIRLEGPPVYPMAPQEAESEALISSLSFVHAWRHRFAFWHIG